jgi:hypothetical protein
MTTGGLPYHAAVPIASAPPRSTRPAHKWSHSSAARTRPTTKHPRCPAASRTARRTSTKRDGRGSVPPAPATRETDPPRDVPHHRLRLTCSLTSAFSALLVPTHGIVWLPRGPPHGRLQPPRQRHQRLRRVHALLHRRSIFTATRSTASAPRRPGTTTSSRPAPARARASATSSRSSTTSCAPADPQVEGSRRSSSTR